MDPDARELIEQANKVLFDTDANGNQFPTNAYLAYQDAQDALMDALANYENARSDIDFNNKKQQRKWQGEAKRLQQKIQRARDNVTLYKAVEQALETKRSRGNDAVAYVISNARQVYGNSKQTSNSTGGTYHVSYTTPQTFWDFDTETTTFAFSSQETTTTHSQEADSYGGKAAFGMGLWSFGASASYSNSSEHFNTQAQDVSLSFQYKAVMIKRDWMDTTLFRMAEWNMKGVKAGGVSDGKVASTSGELLPHIPTAFVLAKNVQIKGNWSESDQQAISHHLSTSASFGYGPFSLKGSYSNASGSGYSSHTDADGTITSDGTYVIGVILSQVPFSPRLAG